MRDFKSKKMPMKPMQQKAADDELSLDMPESDEDKGSDEADDDLLPKDEHADEKDSSILDGIADDELLAEVKKRGLSMDDADKAQAHDDVAADDEAAMS